MDSQDAEFVFNFRLSAVMWNLESMDLFEGLSLIVDDLTLRNDFLLWLTNNNVGQYWT